MYKILKSTPNGIDELELEQLEKGCWIDIVSPSPEELHEIAAQFCGNFLNGKSFYQDADSFKIAGAAVDESNIMDLAVNDVIIYLLRAGAAGFVRIHKFKPHLSGNFR